MCFEAFLVHLPQPEAEILEFHHGDWKFKCVVPAVRVPCFLLKVSMSMYSVDERHDSVTRDSCPQ